MSVFTDKSIKNKRFVWDFKKCQIETDATLSKKIPPHTNVEMTFLVATLVWMPPTRNKLTAVVCKAPIMTARFFFSISCTFPFAISKYNFIKTVLDNLHYHIKENI